MVSYFNIPFEEQKKEQEFTIKELIQCKDFMIQKVQ